LPAQVDDGDTAFFFASNFNVAHMDQNLN